MGPTGRKRSRSVVEENRAECPFTVTMISSPTRADKERQKTKKQKRDGPEDEKKVQYQISPFEPTGKFKTHETMDLHYTVEPRRRWLDMTRYNSFVLNGHKYYSEGFVYVANEATIERQKTASNPDGLGPVRRSYDDWVARILEIRAADEHHVYARVYWMYSPDELPPGTIDGKKSVQGRQLYHGQNELIASNHMDVINVVSVTMPATVNQWIESDDDEVQDALYWRQAFDCRTSQLSSVELICKCGIPANPDKTLIGCTNKDCGKWLHSECLHEEVLAKVYERLGIDKPHVSDSLALKVKKEAEEEKTTRPLSPTETGVGDTQQTIDVRGGETSNDVAVKPGDEGTPKPTTEIATPGPQVKTPLSASKVSSETRRRKRKADSSPKQYEGLFEATLRMNDGPTVWVIKDLRENVTGGDKEWTEPAKCPLCDVPIN